LKFHAIIINFKIILQKTPNRWYITAKKNIISKYRAIISVIGLK